MTVNRATERAGLNEDKGMNASGSVRTRASLTRDFADLGVRPGDVLMVNSSLSRIGFVAGGATAVVQALLDAVGPDGTVVVPAQTPDNRDPSIWFHRPVPQAWWERIRAELPAFDPQLSPSDGMGAIAERVRTWPGAARSPHPLTSFAAVGAHAAELTARHDLSCLLGDHSPLGALERIGARVLLLGVGFEKCTAFHLGESRLPGGRVAELTAPMRVAGGRAWVRYETTVLDDRDFGELGAAFENAGEVVQDPVVHGAVVQGAVVQGAVGSAWCRLFPMREAVRFAQSWLAPRRPPRPGPAPTKARNDDVSAARGDRDHARASG